MLVNTYNSTRGITLTSDQTQNKEQVGLVYTAILLEEYLSSEETQNKKHVGPVYPFLLLEK